MASTTGVDAAPVGVQGPKDCSIPISLRSLSYFTESPVTRRTPNYEDDLFPESVWGAHRIPDRATDGSTHHDQYLEYMGLKVESQRLSDRLYESFGRGSEARSGEPSEGFRAVLH